MPFSQLKLTPNENSGTLLALAKRREANYINIDRFLDYMKTWEEIESVDDLVTDGERVIIKEIEVKLTVRCPYTRKLGEYFYYCSGGVSEDTELKFDAFNPIVTAKQEVAQLQLHCMDRYKDCCHYKGSLPFPSSNNLPAE